MLISRSNKHLISLRLILNIYRTRRWLLYRKLPNSRMLSIPKSSETWSGRLLDVDHCRERRRTDQLDSTLRGKLSHASRQHQADNQISSPTTRRLDLIPSNLVHPLPSELPCRQSIPFCRLEALSKRITPQRLGPQMGWFPRVIPSGERGGSGFTGCKEG